MSRNDPNRPGQKSGGGEEDVYDNDASDPEVPKRESHNKEPQDKPSQAEGDEETVDADLRQKNRQ